MFRRAREAGTFRAHLATCVSFGYFFSCDNRCQNALMSVTSSLLVMYESTSLVKLIEQWVLVNIILKQIICKIVFEVLLHWYPYHHFQQGTASARR
jgi:hypothetical protein